MRRCLYKYFTDPKWAEAFLDGEVLFRSLSYFRDWEDGQVRGDEKEGVSDYCPVSGLEIHNQTQGLKFRSDFTFEATANQEEIYVYCVSRSFTDELRKRFEAIACVEIQDIPRMCGRIKTGLPPYAKFHAKKVTYYDPKKGPEARWALPDEIATSKFTSYRWQNEFRFIFSLTDALEFEKAKYRLVRGETKLNPKPNEHHCCTVRVGNLREFCRLRAF